MGGASEVGFRVLGPLEALVGGRRLVLAGHKQRAVLAVLLLHANNPVATDSIIDAVWGDEPPPTAGHAVQVYVSQLRKLLIPGKGPKIVREAGGYRLQLQREALDLCRFEDLIAEGRRNLIAGEAGSARDNLEGALQFWRATPFAEFAYDDFARTEIERLEDLRVTACEHLADARLRLGEHMEVVDDLYALAARFPLREKLRAQLMLALYRCGRQADALQVYRETRQVLSEELGIDPNPLMQRLHEQVLQQSPDLDIATSGRSDGAEIAFQPADAESSETPLAPPAEVVQEMRTVSVLMAGMAIPTEGVDAERLDQLRRESFEIMSSIALSAGATVGVGGSDPFTAVFGVPQLHEDDASRALTTAITIRDRLRQMVPYFEDRYGFAPTVRIAVDTGEVLFPIGGEGFAFTGAPFTRASELIWMAPPHDVLVGDRAYRSAEAEFACECEKAASGAGPVWRVGMRRVDPARRTGTADAMPLLGRVREMETLRAMYESSTEDLPPQMVHILGEAGIGKTRLVDEFLIQLASDGAAPLVLKGRCLPYGEGITYWALREAVWELAGIEMNDLDAAKKLQRLVVRYLPNAGPERDRVLDTLAMTAGIDMPAPSFEDMSPETVGEEIALGWPSFVSALAADRPVVLVLEDLHWAEDVLLDMIRHIRLRAVGNVLILATARPSLADTTAAGAALAGSLQLSLAPLSRHENLALLARMIPTADQALRHRLADLAQGNPFFVQELVRRLVDEAAGRDDAELLRTGTAAELSLPDTVRGVLAARLDALPDAEKRTLQEASVVGRVFWTSLVQRMQPNADVGSHLQSLEARGFIVLRPRSSLPGDKEFAFSHGLIRETAYASIPPSRRGRAHALVGSFIEERSAGQRAAFVEVIAHHYATAAAGDAKLAWADDPETREEIRRKAVSVLLEAGRLARSRYAIDSSLAFFDRATTLSSSEEERFAVSEDRALSAHAAVRTDLAWTSYVDALAIARRMGDRTKELRVTAAAALLCARYGGAFTSFGWRSELPQMISAGLREDVKSDAGSLERAALLVGRAGLVLWGVSDLPPEEALLNVQEAISIAERLGSPTLLAHALDVLRSLVLVQDGFCRSGELAARMIDVSDRIADPMESHELLVEATDAFCEARSFKDAESTASRASTAAARLSPHHKLHAASAQVSLLYPQGAMKDLLHAAEDAIEIVLDENGQTCMRGELAIFGSALALYEGGRGSEAEEVLQLVSTALSPPSSAASFYLRGAEMLRPLRGLDRTAEELRSIRYIEGGAAEIWFLRAQLPVLALMADDTGVREAAGRARHLATSACAPALAPIADMAEAILMAREGSSSRAAVRAESGRSKLSKLGEPYPAARLVVDLIPYLTPADARRLSRTATASLEELGARTTVAALTL